MRQCADCRNGEHANYDEDVRLTVARDPDTGKIGKRAYLCSEHRAAYLDDGYALKVT